MTVGTIDAEALAGAEAVMGVRYTGSERALMADNLGVQVDMAVRRRAVPLPHDLPPACRFDPRPPGFVPPASRRSRPLPDRMHDTAFAPVWRLAGWIASRAIPPNA